MSLYHYQFSTSIVFSDCIRSHHYLLRCMPFENAYQHVWAQTCKFEPKANISEAVDSFGNRLQYGFLEPPHAHFEFESEGYVELKEYRLEEPLNRLFLYDSDYTTPKQLLLSLSKQGGIQPEMTACQKVTALSERLNQVLTYQSGSTTVKTSAEEALTQGKGVCQDFAHALIALCRLHRIPARYVSGFTAGEGVTHAWMEYYQDGCWYGFDPTRNLHIHTGYIKLAHGRDYKDCPIDKGVFRGIAYQNLSIKVAVIQQ